MESHFYTVWLDSYYDEDEVMLDTSQPQCSQMLLMTPADRNGILMCNPQ